MITNKENWIEQAMIKMDYRLIEEHMKEYNISEYEARKSLSEMYYDYKFKPTKINLCDDCIFPIAECRAKPEDVIYGDGIGNDNIIKCSKQVKPW